MKDNDPDYRVPALQRGLNILELYTDQVRSLSMNELAERLGVSVSSIYRIVVTLTEMGYLEKNAKGSFALGSRIVSRGFAYLASRDLVDVALPHMKALRDRTSLSCHLGIREKNDTLYICRAFADQRLSVNIPIGTRIPCHRNAMGRILLLSLSPTEVEQLYQHYRFDDWTTVPRTLPELQTALGEARAQGWTFSQSDYASAIATAIRDHRGEIVAAINLSAPESMMSNLELQSDMLKALSECAGHISSCMGYAG